ncbi:hypothetical protein CAMGR0001_2810 [Campylobacter gracilis RM3268]|uniref:Uncharacterized protein n=1 Tax=Campylobacter gracilis RM3268 TaxID=553220 RepID=C8PL20_9BACT|nr:hypothetical protein CAMGR0001_2810 [Campylobacter gracilis RM3268]
MRFLLRKFATAKEIYVASFKILSFAGYLLFAAFATRLFHSAKAACEQEETPSCGLSRFLKSCECKA